MPIAIRALRAEDTDAVVGLYAACVATEPGIGPITPNGWAGWMRQARFGYGRDSRVAFDGADPVGLAESSLREDGTQVRRFVKILVHPDHRRRGLGTRLLRVVVDQGPSDEAVVIESLPRTDWIAGTAFALRFGFSVEETEIFMRCPALRSVSGGPSGLTVARTAPGIGAERAAAIHNAAYRVEASFVRSSRRDMLESLRDAQLWTARLDGTVVAFAIVEKEADVTWLESIAVDPPYQARGIGGLLAVASLVGEGVREGRPAWLNVSSSNTAARKLYARLGFEPHSERPRYGALRQDLLAKLAS